MSFNRTELRVVTDEELRGCGETGTCCRCGACCFAFDVEDVPVPDGAPGTVKLDPDGRPMTMDKPSGQFCPHLKNNDDGTLDCGLHGSPMQPSDCRDWRGNEIANYSRMLRILHGHVLMPRREEGVEGVQLLYRTNALGLLRRNPARHYDGPPPSPASLLETKNDFLGFVQSYILKLGIVDEALFDRIGVGEYVRVIRRTEHREMLKIINALHFYGQQWYSDVFRQFVETHFEPDERTKIWAS